jgi:hypothetical protein
MMPTKNGERPIDSDASLIEPTRISDITPTATPAPASISTDLRTDHGSATWSSGPCAGLNRSLCVRSEKKRPATYVTSSTIATPTDSCSTSDG